ncbi:proton-conducting transporter transmembrane domain-containing protein [Reichenbachiella ulvae]|uniref:Probable inorganic carbon transporter subunit DabB n=1 Tax=Reichenbachiella ulvae TaxID=2980104 RepID=A0ABT3CSG4_9BACT|nr:proton-conducting transporter membrane subunit [Reichenbachiella ulvae]MCV9386622.1 proton-conducting transporter membrane subunit [Reichenbachiella ulvae]
MSQNLLFLIASLPLIMVVLAVSSRKARMAIKSGKMVLGLTTAAALSVLIYLIVNAQTDRLTIGWELVSFRFDTLSVSMLLMVSIIGLVVSRFSQNYLEGDPRQLVFVQKLLLTIALVQLLVVSGSVVNLFVCWVATSVSLQYLILHFKERKETQRAVKKKFVVARLSDLSLAVGFSLLYIEFGTVQLEGIFQDLKELSAISANLELAGVFIVMAAMIKSVQIPFHSWILDVMEAPTPVSALLHAGLLNAGPFLIIRFAYLMEAVTVGPVILLALGGITALYGTIVFPSQPAVKTSLAYSSIGHMGFSLMMCGMGLYSASLLHLIAHSFYKAHSFLSSGSAIDYHRLKQLKGNHQLQPTALNILVGFLMTCAMYLVIAELWGGVQFQHFQKVVLGAIIITGVSSYLAKTTSLDNGLTTLLKSVALSAGVLLSFFTFEHGVEVAIASQIPETYAPGVLMKSISISILILYVATVFVPMLIDGKQEIKFKWETHRRNGFYLHVLLDRAFSTVNQKLSK